MSVNTLERYLPEDTLPFLKKWFEDHTIHIKITKNRNSKLGDYRKLRDLSHEITINSTLAPQLFFFVLTHELAHLLAFEKFGRRIAAHGREWKITFRSMLLESIDVYDNELKSIILKFAKSPKANFMSSPDLVKFFRPEMEDDLMVYIENIEKGSKFLYREEAYVLEGLIKKNYLCMHLSTGRKYAFRPLARVKKCI
ncbi:transcription elongation protein SprT [Chryseobacterium sp. Leaf180]|uniref:SprT-like domain-containing protein n=1 Tax=Chryseobacterium sp. Leaf180 TaxID=1736289 RepID=UPI0006FA4B5B|nr:SprT-like domain-containing protein [Chryseobacterium sp. Leaf180]KQR95266.1 transcription elongation protein SprT [Chryseobacterium sp. Leaf180]